MRVIAFFISFACLGKVIGFPCHSGWTFNNHNCYKVYSQFHKSWSDSEEFCRVQKGNLVEIETFIDQAFIRCLIANTSTIYWIGLKADSNPLRWSTGSQVITDYRHNKSYSPQQFCYGISKNLNGDWERLDCNKRHAFICQHKITGMKYNNHPFREKIKHIFSAAVSLKFLDTLKYLVKSNATLSCERFLIPISFSITEGQRDHWTDHKKVIKGISIDRSIRLNHTPTPLKHNPTPLKHNPTPLKLNSTSLKHNPTPLKHNSTPLKHNPTPLKHNSTPLKHNPTPKKHKPTEKYHSKAYRFEQAKNPAKRLRTTTEFEYREATTKPLTTSTQDGLLTAVDGSNNTEERLIPTNTPLTILPTSEHSPHTETTHVTDNPARTTADKPSTHKRVTQEATPHQTVDLKMTQATTPHQTVDLKMTQATTPHQTADLTMTQATTPHQTADLKLTQATTPHQTVDLKMLFRSSTTETSWTDQPETVPSITTLTNKLLIADFKKSLNTMDKEPNTKVLEQVLWMINNTLGDVNTGLGTTAAKLLGEKQTSDVNVFDKYFYYVDFFVDVCNENKWQKNEQETIIKEIVKNTDPFLKYSLLNGRLHRYIRRTLEYVDLEIMNIDKGNISDMSCSGRNGTWQVNNMKFTSAVQNESVFLSIIMFNTPVISVENCSQSEQNVTSSYLISPLLSIVAYNFNKKVQLSHQFSLQIHPNITNIFRVNSEEYRNVLMCVFLDNQNGLWSNYGCNVTSESASHVNCSCNHTTNFAILMQVTQFKITGVEEKILNTISYIGCSISLITQFITIAVFTFVEILSCERVFVHRNLCIAIVGAQITFLVGIKAVDNKILCSVIAGLLHYWYMAVFAWMLVEGIHLYNRVVRVFGSELSRRIYYGIFGWGMPVLLVTISAATDWKGYGTKNSCWLSIKEDTIWAFVGPAIAIILVNLIILACVTKIVITSAKHGNNSSKFYHIRAGVKGALFLLPILGMTWIFGLLSVNRQLLIFQYLFAIFNSLQGFFIFIFHVVLNTEVRQALLRLKERRSLQRGDQSSASSNTSVSLRTLGEKSSNVWIKSRKISPISTSATTTSTSTVTKTNSRC